MRSLPQARPACGFWRNTGSSCASRCALGQAQCGGCAAVNAQPPVQSNSSPASWALPCPRLYDALAGGATDLDHRCARAGRGCAAGEPWWPSWVPATVPHARGSTKVQSSRSELSAQVRFWHQGAGKCRWTAAPSSSMNWAMPHPGEQVTPRQLNCAPPCNGKLIAVHVAAGAYLSVQAKPCW